MLRISGSLPETCPRGSSLTPAPSGDQEKLPKPADLLRGRWAQGSESFKGSGAGTGGLESSGHCYPPREGLIKSSSLGKGGVCRKSEWAARGSAPQDRDAMTAMRFSFGGRAGARHSVAHRGTTQHSMAQCSNPVAAARAAPSLPGRSVPSFPCCLFPSHSIDRGALPGLFSSFHGIKKSPKEPHNFQ